MGTRNRSVRNRSGLGHQGADRNRGQRLAGGLLDQESEAYGAQTESGLGRRILRRRLGLVGQVDGAPNYGQGSPEDHHDRQDSSSNLSYRKHRDNGTR
jgi:hypothetical protein